MIICLYLFGILGSLFFLGNIVKQGISSSWTTMNDGDYVWSRGKNPIGYWFSIFLNLFLSLIFFLLAFGNISIFEYIQQHQLIWDILFFVLTGILLSSVIRDWNKKSHK